MCVCVCVCVIQVIVNENGETKRLEQFAVSAELARSCHGGFSRHKNENGPVFESLVEGTIGIDFQE